MVRLKETGDIKQEEEEEDMFTRVCGQAVHGDIKIVNLRYFGKCLPNCQQVLIPLYTSDSYDTYMDGCSLMSATNISNPTVIILYM